LLSFQFRDVLFGALQEGGDCGRELGGKGGLGCGEGCRGRELEMLCGDGCQQWLVGLAWREAIEGGKRDKTELKYRSRAGGKRGEMRTLVEDNTVFRRGKSEIPESRMEIEESRRERELRREVTDAASEARDCEVVILDGSIGHLG
jgi:hypothetical protein